MYVNNRPYNEYITTAFFSRYLALTMELPFRIVASPVVESHVRPSARRELAE